MNSGFLLTIQKVLETIDRFGVPVRLYYNGNAFNRSYYGGLATLIILGLSFSYFLYTFLDLLQGSQPNIFMRTNYEPMPEPYQYKKDEFFIGIGLSDYYGIPINNTEEQYYQVQLRLTEKNQTNIQKKYVKMVKCSSTEANKMIFKYVNSQLASFAYCVKQQDMDEMISYFRLQGLPSDYYWRYIVLEVFACKSNSTKIKKTDCYKTMSGGQALVFYPDFLIDQENLESPFRGVGRKSLDTYEVQKEKDVYLSFSHSYFKSIEAFYYVFANIFNYHVLQFYSKSTTESDNSLYDKPILSYQFLLTETTYSTTRYYRNVISVLAETSAIMKFMTLMVSLFVERLTLGRIINKMNDKLGYSSIDQNQGLINSNITQKYFNLMDICEILQRVKYLENKVNNMTFQNQLINEKPKCIDPSQPLPTRYDKVDSSQLMLIPEVKKDSKDDSYYMPYQIEYSQT